MADRYWVGGSGTWNTSTTTNWSASSGGSGGASVPTSADNVFIDGNSNTGTSAFTITASGSPVCANLTISGLDGGLTVAGTGVNLGVYGSASISPTNLTSWAPGVGFFGAGSNTVNFNGLTIGGILFFGGFGGGGGTYTLSSNVSTSVQMRLYSGTLDLNNFSLGCGTFESTPANTRVLSFGTSGVINVTGTGTAVDLLGTSFSYTGTPTVNLTDTSGSKSIKAITNFTESNALSFYFTLTTSGSSGINSSGATVGNITTTGTGTFNFSGTCTVYKTITLGSGATISGVSTLNFSGTTGSYGITSNGATFTNAIVFPAGGANYSLSDNFLTSYTLTISGGSLSVNGKTLTSSTSAITFSSGTLSLGAGSITAPALTQSGGTLNVNTGTITLSGTFTLTGGTIDFGSVFSSISCATWSSSTGTRTINWRATSPFVSAIVYITGSSITHNATSLTTTNGPGQFYHTGSSLTTLNISNFTESTAPNLYATGAITSTAAVLYKFERAGSGAMTGNATVYNGLVLASGSTASSGTITLASTITGHVVQSNGGSVSGLTVNCPGTSCFLSDALTCTGTLTLTAGTFDASNYNVTVSSFTNTSTSTRTLTMGSGTWSIASGGWNPTLTGLTLNVNTSTIKLSTTGSMTFAGQGLTYYNLDFGGGTLNAIMTISGSNTFTTISSSASTAASIRFTAGTTQTITNFTASGTSGNLLTLRSVTAGSKWYLSKTSGTVSIDYVSITDSTVNAGPSWYAGANSTDNGNNIGWVFSRPYTVGGQFFDVISSTDE